MNPITREWVEKAEGDWNSALREIRARKHPNYDSACFHAQQCAEKYMKAVLCETGMLIDKVHDLGKVLDQVKVANPMWEVLRPAAIVLTDYGVRFRYPGSSADKIMAGEAVKHCRLIRELLAVHLGKRLTTRMRRGRGVVSRRKRR